jgi:hypothetical protein
LFGVFDDAQVTNVIGLINKINDNALVGGFGKSA